MLKVFITDDSALVRERLVALISELDTVELVGQAENAPKAIQAIEQLKPDVVILDIRLPEGNGIDVLKTVKQNVSAPTVIMLTAFPYQQFRHKCQEAGAEYFFDKTSEFHCIVDVLKQLQNNRIEGEETHHKTELQ
jgi:DNA-binding NarL/FixJ family response regulator